MQKVRCAIYTRKSSEDGLEQEFNSLDAQREACSAYVTSQKAEGWVELAEPYDDGGLSGGTLVRPALQRLLEDVDAGKVDRIIVYKIDRLTRSLADFAKIVDRLDTAEASFVSVTQSFNTATSMGRLTLNMLLSFAQFEREVTAERIRDKLAASKRKGLWMGGNVPIGYRPNERTLTIDEDEASTVRKLYELYEQHRSLAEVVLEAQALGLRTRRRERADGSIKGGEPFGRSHIHHILSNPIYAGKIRHKEKVYEGQHAAIIEPEHWGMVQELLTEQAGRDRGSKSGSFMSRLAGKLIDETGDRLTPSHTKKNGKRLRYYISGRLVTGKASDHPSAWRLPAPRLEAGVAKAVRDWAQKPTRVLRLVDGLAAEEIEGLASALRQGTANEASTLHLVERINLAQREMRIALSSEALAATLSLQKERINTAATSWSLPFQIRRRHVEKKLIIGAEELEHDTTLIANTVKARGWYRDIVSGLTFQEIADRDGTSKRRVQAVIELAFLSPDLLKQLAAGSQPHAMTTDRLIKRGLPISWDEQAATLKA